MTKLLVIVGSTIGSWVGWWLGSRFGFMTGFFRSIVWLALGVYAARRLAFNYDIQ